MPHDLDSQIPQFIQRSYTESNSLPQGAIQQVNNSYYPPQDNAGWQSRWSNSWREVGEKGSYFSGRVRTVLKDSLMLVQSSNGTPYILPPGKYFQRWRKSFVRMQTSVINLLTGPNPLVTADGQCLKWTYLRVPPDFTCDLKLRKEIKDRQAVDQTISTITLKPGDYWVDADLCDVHAYYLRDWRTSSVISNEAKVFLRSDDSQLIMLPSNCLAIDEKGVVEPIVERDSHDKVLRTFVDRRHPLTAIVSKDEL